MGLTLVCLHLTDCGMWRTPPPPLPTGALLGLTALLSVIMGGRSSVLGLAGFVTMPSREVVSIWQFIAITFGTGEDVWVHQKGLAQHTIDSLLVNQ